MTRWSGQADVARHACNAFRNIVYWEILHPMTWRAICARPHSLNPIDPALASDGCEAATVYQRTDAYVLATFSDGSTTASQLDVTCDVGQVASAGGVVVVSGRAGQIVLLLASQSTI
jgi:hypothetical protein